jgi:hypothetical protein
LKRAAQQKVAEAAAEIAAAESHQGKVALEGRAPNEELVAAFAEARRHLALLKEEARAIPAKVALGELHPDAARLDPERKRIMDAVRISAYNAETALCRMLRPHYRRAEDEARTLAQEIYADAGDIEVMGDRLVVRLEPLSAPNRTRALAALCGELTATETAYPGTGLTLVYEVKMR